VYIKMQRGYVLIAQLWRHLSILFYGLKRIVFV